MIESSISRYFVNKVVSTKEIQIVSGEWNPWSLKCVLLCKGGSDFVLILAAV